jgi:Family of unknown function (DUF5677)
VGKFQKLLNTEIQKVPDLLLRNLVTEKLEEAGVKRSDLLVDCLVQHIKDGGDTPFEWPDTDHDDLTISFGQADVERLEGMADGFAEDMPQMISDMSRKIAVDTLKTFRKDWREYRPSEDIYVQQFRKNLVERWNKGLESLHLLLNLSRDVGTSFNKRLRRSTAKKGKYTRDVLGKLHVRGCQVSAEILMLVENGYADGAMARWRTLHEISIVATLIAENGDELAMRYIEHSAVEAKRAMDEFVRCHTALGYASPTKREIASVVAKFDSAVQRFGKDFSTPYGWAVGHSGITNPNPKFRDLEDAAGRAMMRSYYKMASYNVHASSKGLLFRLGTIDDPSHLIAGATNAGLEEPGQNMAFTLTQLTALLIGPKYQLDDLIQLQILTLLRDGAVAGLIKSARKLRTDERRIRKASLR